MNIYYVVMSQYNSNNEDIVDMYNHTIKFTISNTEAPVLAPISKSLTVKPTLYNL